MENDYLFWSNFWTAMSAIGSFAVAAVAIVIVKWQDIITNKKKLKIEWRHVQKNGAISILFTKGSSNKEFDGIQVQCINTGNRKIILNGMNIEAPDKSLIPMLQFWILHRMEPAITFPYVLEEEMLWEFYLPNYIFCPVVNQLVLDKTVLPNDKVVVVASDATGKTYKLNTRQRFKTYLSYENPDVEF